MRLTTRLAIITGLLFAIGHQAFAQRAPRPPKSLFRQRFGAFQPAAVKRAARLANETGKQDGNWKAHDGVLRGAVADGVRSGTLSIRSAIYLAKQTRLTRSHDAIGTFLARKVGTQLSFKEQKLLVSEATHTESGARRVARMLIKDNKLTAKQVDKLEALAERPVWDPGTPHSNNGDDGGSPLSINAFTGQVMYNAGLVSIPLTPDIHNP